MPRRLARLEADAEDADTARPNPATRATELTVAKFLDELAAALAGGCAS
ncbi:MAG: hypothetical protein ICV73_30455 [Acetobacteraceae bacterium]|nr:hypothetical protein [Acetobacteraceae bacterium]